MRLNSSITPERRQTYPSRVKTAVNRQNLAIDAAFHVAVMAAADAELIAMAAHYAALPLVPQSAPLRTDAFERVKALAGRALCNTCHLPTYLGQQQVPRVAGQREDYLLHCMRQFRDGKTMGRDSIMASSLYGLTDLQLTDLAHFFSQVK